MSALTDKIVAEHDTYLTYLTGGDLRASCEGCDWTFEGDSIDAVVECSRHVAAVTEAAVREHIAAALDDLARARHDDLKETKRRTRAETFAGASAMAYELAARIARGEQ